MKRALKLPNGFSLVEVTLALGLAAFCLVAIFALFPVGLASNLDATRSTVATCILSVVTADLDATPPTFPIGKDSVTPSLNLAVPANPITGTPAPVTLYFSRDGRHSTTPEPDSEFLLTVKYVPFSSGGGTRSATLANLTISWPAVVSLEKASGYIQTSIAFNRN